MDLNLIQWGDDSAERDKDLLSYFVDTETYKRLVKKNKFLVIGRKGSGKSALRKKLGEHFSKESDTHVINISPKYASIRNILNEELLKENFGDEIFFQHSWIRQIFLDCLCEIGHKAKGKYATDSLDFSRNVAKDLNRTSKDIVENISDILNKIKIKAGSLGELGIHLEKELRNVADVDALEHHFSNLVNSGAKFVVMVDDLDLGWDNSKLSNNLLLGLLAATSYLKSISENIHIVVFLREDVYSILMENTQHSDKYRNIESIRWEKGQLIALLEKRIRFNMNQRGEVAQQECFSQIFPTAVGTHNTDNWLIERTLSRPRELLQLSRNYTESCEGSFPSDTTLKMSETVYSGWKLDDLCTEYSNQYPGLSEIFSFWKTRFFRYKYHMKYDDILELFIVIFDECTINQPWFNKIVNEVDFNKFLSVFYEIGFIGDFVLGGEGGSKTFYSFSDRHEPNFKEVQIHPCFRKAVGTVERIRN